MSEKGDENGAAVDFGSCGCGKSHRMYEQLIKASMEHPQQIIWSLCRAVYHADTKEYSFHASPPRGNEY